MREFGYTVPISENFAVSCGQVKSQDVLYSDD